MAALSFAQLEQLWINAGGPGVLAPVMAAIALAESGGDPSQVNPTDNGGKQSSWGLWQISDGTHNAPAGWADPYTNAKLAVAKYHSQGLSAWGTYTSGAYKQFLSSGSPLPDGSAGGPPDNPTRDGGSTTPFVPRPLSPQITATLVVVVGVLLLFVALGYHAKGGAK